MLRIDSQAKIFFLGNSGISKKHKCLPIIGICCQLVGICQHLHLIFQWFCGPGAARLLPKGETSALRAFHGPILIPAPSSEGVGIKCKCLKRELGWGGHLGPHLSKGCEVPPLLICFFLILEGFDSWNFCSLGCWSRLREFWNCRILEL